MFLGLATTVFADQITLKNGDRLTGTVVKSDGKTLVLHTEFAGDVTLQFAAITQITTDKPLHVALKNGQTVVGPITTSDGKLEVATKTGASVEAPKENVVAIRNDADELAYEKALHPNLLHGWNGGANVGFSLTGGNSQTENLSIAFNAARATKDDKLSLYSTIVYGTNQLATPSTTANIETGGIRYDRNINPRMFGFISADLMSNALQDLNLRSVGSVGLGYHGIKNDRTTLDFLAGGNFTDENYSQTGEPDRDSANPGDEGHTQFRRPYSGRGADAQAGKDHSTHREAIFLSRPYRDGAVPGNVRPGVGHENQQMAGLAEPVQRYLRLEPARGRQAE